MQYPYSRPHLNDDDIAEVMSVLQVQFLTQGPVVVRLEEALQNLFSIKHAIICNSGTAALHMAYDGLGIGPDAGLITSAVTFLATANAARMCNAPVGLADVDPVTGNVTLETIKAAVEAASFKVRAIAVVHLGGRPCEMIAISAYAKSIGAYLVEDACHAPMAEYTNGTAGSAFTVGSCAHSDVATLSFHAIKHITAGEGGVLLTNSDILAKNARLFRSHGMVRDQSELKNRDNLDAPWYYEMHSLGYNYRLSDLNCALALNQVSRLAKNNQRRQEIAALYHQYLDGMDFVKLPEIISPENGSHAWHLFAPQFDFDAIGKSRREIMLALADQDIGSQVHYIPLYHQPYYQNDYSSNVFSGAEEYYRQTLSLPMYYGLDDDDVVKIAQIIKSVVSG
ncbi:DegT/DnrJ/EryC1/StrS family aminotransferase [Alphaproteobacteria bacterium]|nr:DegT/DnrJ/EryC1/StrS family aminotransferase [Alphaproteobacteria bacterium]